MFSDNEYLTPEDVENNGMFTSISIDDIPEGSIKMDLKFKDTHEMYLYLNCDTSEVQDVISNKDLILGSNLYESLNTLKAVRNRLGRSKAILEIVVDTSNGLDLLNIHDIGQLKKYYDWGIRTKAFKSNIEEVDLINSYIKANKEKIKLLRFLRQLENKLYPKSKLTVGSFIVYRVYDNSIIKSIKEIPNDK